MQKLQHEIKQKENIAQISQKEVENIRIEVERSQEKEEIQKKIEIMECEKASLLAKDKELEAGIVAKEEEVAEGRKAINDSTNQISDM
ncbi:hypothetical protein Pmani_024101 [Petrolisthes manimaculis]|uniref:Uncharacterized protein n=1 Tax=Petrolisthes manimaculis TaxID=1843537 RepID=A0AAE1PAR5_9EUCA|nr:hypothetical protein Pmani_024101 [Petrolisthes manimaculis]